MQEDLSVWRQYQAKYGFNVIYFYRYDMRDLSAIFLVYRSPLRHSLLFLLNQPFLASGFSDGISFPSRSMPHQSGLSLLALRCLPSGFWLPTPVVYKFSGSLDEGDQIHIQAIPLDENLKAQEASLKIRAELPREIHFDFNRK